MMQCQVISSNTGEELAFLLVSHIPAVGDCLTLRSTGPQPVLVVDTQQAAGLGSLIVKVCPAAQPGNYR